jgi:hypothetical protein
MSHGSETRKMRGGDTGVKGRRSREGAGLGESLRATGPQGNLKPSARKAIRATEQMWNDVSHEWLGTNKSSFPYNMGKWDKDKGQGSSMLTMPRTVQGREPGQGRLSGGLSRDKYSQFENRVDSSMMDGRHRESLMLPLVQRGKSAYKNDRSPPSEPAKSIKPQRKEPSYSPPANYHPSGVRMTDAEAYAQEDWNQRKNRNHKPYVERY